MAEDGVLFSITTGYGVVHQAPFVGIEVADKDFAIKMSPEDAKQLALDILEAAEAATTDAFIVTFGRRFGLSDPSIQQWLNEFRSHREEEGGRIKADGSQGN